MLVGAALGVAGLGFAVLGGVLDRGAGRSEIVTSSVPQPERTAAAQP